MTLRCADMFAGAGGLSLGFQSAGFNVVWAGEKDPRACDTFEAAHPHTEVFCGTLSGEEVPKVDVLIGGPPCQPFSSAGARRGQYDDRDMIPVFLTGLRWSKPSAFLMEEVDELTSAANRTYLRTVLDDMADLGFVVDHRVLDAADYRVPQNRRRLFIVGFDSKAAAQRFRWPAAYVKRVTVREAIRDLVPFFGPGPTRHSVPVDLAMPLPGARLVDRGAGGERKKSRPKSVLYKLTRPNSQANTITVSAETAGSEYAIRIAVEWDDGDFVRRVAIPELARLQGFPDNYPWHGNPTQIRAQIGNSVCPPVAYELARSIANAIE